MHPNYLDILKGGLVTELHHLPSALVLSYIENYISHQHCDVVVASAFANRLSTDARLSASPAGKALLWYCLEKYFEQAPLVLPALRAMSGRKRAASLPAALRVLEGFQKVSDKIPAMDALSSRGEHEEASALAEELLRQFPGCVQAARVLLAADYAAGRLPGAWQAGFKCPKAVQPLWDGQCFRHHAALSDVAGGLRLWNSLAPEQITPTDRNHAAELLRMAGDLEGAREQYAKSLVEDPRQLPMRRRLEALETDFQVRRDLVEERRVAVYLYSWNKAELLARTLDSLAESDLGPAQVRVLVNGCTDDSAQVVRSRKDRFGGRLEAIELPVNIGAPAARNWLIAQDLTWQSDYVAFADDDVEMPRDWLAHYLTVAEADARCGVVGCKVVFPGAPAKVQYLSRYVSIADHGLLKLCLPAPMHYYDNGWYDVVRPVRSVMGCLHLFWREALADCPRFDIRFSPSQVDDIDHDLQLGLKGWNAWYTGHVTCVHHHGSATGTGVEVSEASVGNTVGNDFKLFFKHSDNLDALRGLDSLSLCS